MTNKDFFRVLIRIIGLFVFFQIALSFLPSQLQMILMDIGSDQKLSAFLYFALILGFCLLVLIFLLRKPDFIINFLGLDKGYDKEESTITDFNAPNILLLGLILVGGFMVVDNASKVLFYGYEVLKTDSSYSQLYSKRSTAVFSLILASLNVIVGLVLVTYRQQIVGLFYKSK